MPRIHPPITSTGQWTPRFTLDTATAATRQFFKGPLGPERDLGDPVEYGREDEDGGQLESRPSRDHPVDEGDDDDEEILLSNHGDEFSCRVPEWCRVFVKEQKDPFLHGGSILA
jgi:hypothetical protein